MPLFSFLKKAAANPEPPTPSVPTYHERVVAFWRWFEAVAPRFYQAIDNSQCATLTDETIAAVDALGCGFAWVYGPGANGVGHSLTLSGEGNIHRQLLLLHWLACAPSLTGWTFYAARQPGPIEGHAIEIGEQSFAPEKIWVTPTPNPERECIDLTVWHPAWEQITPQQRSTVTFLFLDESLGEYGTDWWIGGVSFGNTQLAGAFPLHELADYVTRTAAERGWNKSIPGETVSLFRLDNPPGGFPRGDIFSQATIVPRLIQDYMAAKGELPDPIKDSGADYAYLSIDAGFFPKGAQVEKRGQIEDALDDALKATRGGRSLGGAFDRERGYVDLLLFDGARSLDTVKKTLREQKVPPGTMIEFFAREHRGRRIAL